MLLLVTFLIGFEMVMSNLVRDPQNLLVIDGVPYSLVREIQLTNPSPCHLCDLSDMCQDQKAGATLMKLCSPKGGTGGEFFIRDFDVLSKTVLSYVVDEKQFESPEESGK